MECSRICSTSIFSIVKSPLLIHWKKFLEFEEEQDLFALREEDLYIWDIIRFHVYLDYMWENFEEQRAKRKTSQKWALSLKRIGYLLSFLFKKTRPNLFFTNSRDRAVDGKFYDKNADDFLRRLHEKAHIIETYQLSTGRYVYPVSLINPASLLNVLHHAFYRKRDYSALLEKINGTLGLKWNNDKINRLISDFKSEMAFYSFLFRFRKPNRIYVTQNGLQKALFYAARNYNIETVEFQHGIIDPGHIAYNYPAGIQFESPIYIPDIFLTFSPFWARDIHYPVKKIIPVGNTGFAHTGVSDVYPSSPANSAPIVGFVSADVFGQELSQLAREYAAIAPDTTILFKLHPNEFARKKEFEAGFAQHPNIRVITNEQPTETVIRACSAIVLIQSTIAYQALQAGVRVFIYKKMTWYRHEHIFDNPNVRLIDHASEIDLAGSTGDIPPVVFFETFNESIYHQLSNFG